MPHCSSRSALTNDTMQHCGLHSALLNDTCTAYIVAYILFYHVVLYLIILFVTEICYICILLSPYHMDCPTISTMCVCLRLSNYCVFVYYHSHSKNMINCDFFSLSITIKYQHI